MESAGVSSTTTPQYTSFGSGASHLVAGFQSGSIQNTHYEGRIDELQYFQAALTSTQVTNLINNNSVIAGNYHYTPSRTFNGTSDFIDVPDTASLDLNQFSISAWFRTSKDYHLPTDDPGGEAGIILVKTMWRTQEHVNYGMWVTDANGIRGGFLEADGTEHLAKSTDSGLPGANTVNDGQWHMANITYDGASVKCYIDAVLHDSRAVSGATPEILSTKMRIGANCFEGFESTTVGVHMYFKGELDEIYIWNNDLTAAEITALYTAGTVPQSGAIVYQNHF